MIASTITYTRPLGGIKLLPLNMDRGLTPASYSFRLATKPNMDADLIVGPSYCLQFTVS